MRIRSVILLVFALVSGVSAQQQTILFVRNSVKVSSTDVLLGDIISDDSIYPEVWSKRRICSAPPVGEVIYLPLTRVATALSHYNDMQSVVLRGEPTVSIQRVDRLVERQELKDALMKYLGKTKPWDALDLQVKILNFSDSTRIPEGEAEFEVSQFDQRTARGFSQAQVQVRVDGVMVCEIAVELEIRTLTEVWVVRDGLAPGHILVAGDLRSEKRVVDSNSGFVPSTESLIGYEVSRALVEGEALPRNALSKPVCVRRGDWVAINAIGENLHITLRGKALANGRLGDRISCINERSQRQVLVELVGVGSGVLIRM